MTLPWILLFVFIAIIIGLLLQADPGITGDKIVLGDPTYDIEPISAPVASSVLLEILAYLFTRTFIRPVIFRKLLNDNHIIRVRELASQIHLPPLYFPMRRVPAEKLNSISKEESDNQLNSFLINGPTFDSLPSQDHIHTRTIEEYAAYYRQGKGLPSDVMKRTLEQVKEWKRSGMIIFSSYHEDIILEQARASDERHRQGKPLSLLDGVPVAFKDMMDINGHISYNGGDKSFKHLYTKSTRDDPIVKRFRDAGAIIFGLTVMVEGGMSPLGWNAHWQGPVSPYSSNRYSGGSSSGSAVAVATGLTPVAIGFDGGGSIRIPATMSGVHGFATTFGRIPFENHTDSTMIKAGPFAASAVDAALAYVVMAPNAPNSFYGRLYDGGVHGPPHPSLENFLEIENLQDVRIGYYSQWFEDSDPIILAECKAVIDYLVSKGATLVPINIPHLQVMSLAHGTKIASEFASSWDLKFHRDPASLEPNSRITVGLGSGSSGLEIHSGEKIRAWAFEYVSKLFEKENLTVIVNPTMGIPVPFLCEETKKRGESNTGLVVKVMKHISLANFLGLPAYSVPIGASAPKEMTDEETEDRLRLPIGFQLIGDHWSEAKLLRLAHSIEQGYVSPKKSLPKPKFLFDPFKQ